MDLNFYKSKTYDNFRRLKWMIDTDSDFIPSQINLVDSQLMHLNHHYGYFPDYQEEFNQLVDSYFGEMVYRVKGQTHTEIINFDKYYFSTN